MIEKGELELSVSCVEVTDLQKDTNVEDRDWFLRVVGQLCLK